MVLSREEIRRMIEATTNIKHKLVLMFLYYARLHLDEVRNLRWQDIDFDRGVIHIKTAKGEKERVVFLHPKLKSMLEISVLISKVWFSNPKEEKDTMNEQDIKA